MGLKAELSQINSTHDLELFLAELKAAPISNWGGRRFVKLNGNLSQDWGVSIQDLVKKAQALKKPNEDYSAVTGLINLLDKEGSRNLYAPTTTAWQRFATKWRQAFGNVGFKKDVEIQNLSAQAAIAGPAVVNQGDVKQKEANQNPFSEAEKKEFNREFQLLIRLGIASEEGCLNGQKSQDVARELLTKFKSFHRLDETSAKELLNCLQEANFFYPSLPVAERKHVEYVAASKLSDHNLKICMASKAINEYVKILDNEKQLSQVPDLIKNFVRERLHQYALEGHFEAILALSKHRFLIGNHSEEYGKMLIGNQDNNARAIDIYQYLEVVAHPSSGYNIKPAVEGIIKYCRDLFNNTGNADYEEFAKNFARRAESRWGLIDLFPTSSAAAQSNRETNKKENLEMGEAQAN